MNTIKQLLNVSLILLSAFQLLAQSVHYQSGLSIRNGAEGHFYKMVPWDDTQYQEYAYSERTEFGAVSEFMNWRVIFPPGYNPNDNTKKYPMIVMLHGAGESGRKWTDEFEYLPTDPEYDNNGHQLLYGGIQHRDAVNRPLGNARAFPGIVIFLQVSYNGAWDTENKRMAILIIERMIKNHHADPFRVHLHGLSIGARGTWSLSTDRPDLISSILPMSGVGTELEAMTDALVTMPIWLFQGGQDTDPSPGAANQWINKLVEKGGQPRFTLYPALGHGTWNSAYNEPDFFSWMLEKNKRKIYIFGDSNASTASIEQPLKLGFSAGFKGYEWRRNGLPIAGANGRYYTATEGGIYTVRFLQPLDSTWAESYPLNLTGETNPGDLVYIPDLNLKSVLITNSGINTNGDTEIQYAEAAAYSGQIKANGQNIASLVGIEAFTSLTDLRLLNNQITAADLSANTALVQLHIQQNQLTSLDLSLNAQLTHIRVFDNDLYELNVQNGNNANFNLFHADQNDLACIQVDDAAYAEANFSDDVDAGVVFSTDCDGVSSEPIVTIPDANFKSALLADATINTNGDAEIQVSEATAQEGAINVSNQGIQDVTGLKAFKYVSSLNVSYNELTSIDLTELSGLGQTYDVEIDASHNQISEVTAWITNVEKLDLSYNELTVFIAEDQYVYGDGYAIDHLDLSHNDLQYVNMKVMVEGDTVNYGGAYSVYNTEGNPSLSCIEVANVGLAEDRWRETTDSDVDFSINCAGVPGGVVYIPDANFKSALLSDIAINTNGDSEIQTTEASAYAGVINVNSNAIVSIEGIGTFTELTDLRVHNNLITAMDLTANTELIQLHCQKNNLMSLDISTNTKINKLRVFLNDLTELNMQNGNNHNFQVFDARDNDLTCIQVDDVAYAEANFTAVVDPGVSFSTNCGGGSSEPIVTIPDANFKAVLLADPSINTNGDDEIQVSETAGITLINAEGAGISDITGVEAFDELLQLNLASNNLTSLDASAMGLDYLGCQNNQLTSLDLGGIIEYLDAYSNPDLTCIQTSTPGYYEDNEANVTVDEGVSFNANCAGVPEGVVYIPDANFKSALLADITVNTNGDSEIQTTEASAFTGMINVNSQGISSIEGIAAFTELTDLRVHNNLITAMDLSANTELIQLHCQKNNLMSLDISTNTKINKLRVFLNDLTELNMQNGNNHNFQVFDARDNDLTCIQVDDEAYAEANFTAIVDPGVSFSVNCSTSSSRIAAEQIAVATVASYSDVRVFPNPSPRKVHVIWEGNSDAFTDAIRLFELTNGREISPLDFRTNGNKITIDMARQASGQYILQLGNKTYRIIKR